VAVQILSPEIRVSLSHSSPSLVTARCFDVVAAPVSVAALLQLLFSFGGAWWWPEEVLPWCVQVKMMALRGGRRG